jgi:hypothetical protein
VEAAATGAGGAAFGSGAFIDIGRVTTGPDHALADKREGWRHRRITPPLAQCTRSVSFLTLLTARLTA